MFPCRFAASIFMLAILAGSIFPITPARAAETNRLTFPRASEYPFAFLAMPRPADGESMLTYLERVAWQSGVALFCPETLSRMSPQTVWAATAKASPTLEEFMDTWARATKTRLVYTPKGAVLLEPLVVKVSDIKPFWRTQRIEEIRLRNQVLAFADTYTPAQLKAMEEDPSGTISYEMLDPAQKEMWWNLRKSMGYSDTKPRNEKGLHIGIFFTDSVLLVDSRKRNEKEHEDGWMGYLPVFNDVTGLHLPAMPGPATRAALEKQGDTPLFLAGTKPVKLPSGTSTTVREAFKAASTPVLTLAADDTLTEKRFFHTSSAPVTVAELSEALTVMYRMRVRSGAKQVTYKATANFNQARPTDAPQIDEQLAPAEFERYKALSARFETRFRRKPYPADMPIAEARFTSWTPYPSFLLPRKERDWIRYAIRSSNDIVTAAKKIPIDNFEFRLERPLWLYWTADGDGYANHRID